MKLVADERNVASAIVAGSFVDEPSPVRDNWLQGGWEAPIPLERDRGVDELIHSSAFALLSDGTLSFVEPHTLVLLTGDGNDNDGRTNFPQIVANALSQNTNDCVKWKVEIWTWASAKSSEYDRFDSNDNFRVNLLDDYRNELLDLSPQARSDGAGVGASKGGDAGAGAVASKGGGGGGGGGGDVERRVAFQCPLHPAFFKKKADFAMAYFAKMHATQELRASLAAVDPRLKRVEITPGVPSIIVVEGDLSAENETNRSLIVEQAKKKISEVLGKVVEDPPFELTGVFSNDEIKADAAVKQAVFDLKVSYYSSSSGKKNCAVGGAEQLPVKVNLCYFRGNETGRDEVKRLMLLIKVEGFSQVNLIEKQQLQQKRSQHERKRQPGKASVWDDDETQQELYPVRTGKEGGFDVDKSHMMPGKTGEEGDPQQGKDLTTTWGL